PPLAYLLLTPLPAPASHAHLHSFPTRRSSDLRRPNDRPSTLPGRNRPRRRCSPAWGRLLTRRGPTLLGRFHHPQHGSAPLHHHQDRKSTRLNSSHVSISYAVFCLKKKKTSPH